MPAHERNKTIDLLRFIFSLLVVTIHADLFSDVSAPLYQCFTLGFVRMGVPFFFIASGYFLMDRVRRGKSSLPGIRRILRLWLLFILLDMAITGWYFYPDFPGPFEFLHKALFTGLSDAYWFLPALAVSQLILIPVFRRRKTPAAIAAGLVLYLFVMTHDSYSFLFEGTWIHQLSALHTKAFIWPQAGLAESIFFLSLGGLFRDKKDRIASAAENTGRLLAPAAGLLTALLVLEAYLTQSRGAYDGNCYLTLILLPAVLFLWALFRDPVRFDTGKPGAASLYIYLVHPIAVSLLRMTGAPSVLRTLAAVGLSLVISFCIVSRKNRTLS